METRAPGCDMLNATLAYRIEIGPKTDAELFMRATNVAKDLAFNHASFINNASPLSGRNFVFRLRTSF